MFKPRQKLFNYKKENSWFFLFLGEHFGIRILRKNGAPVENDLYNKLDFGVLMDLKNLYKMDLNLHYIYFS
jgi:hypothetical protein